MLGHGRTVLASFSHRTGASETRQDKDYYAFSPPKRRPLHSFIFHLFAPNVHSHLPFLPWTRDFNAAKASVPCRVFHTKPPQVFVPGESILRPLCRLTSRSSSSPTRKCSRCSRILHSFYVIPGSAIWYSSASSKTFPLVRCRYSRLTIISSPQADSKLRSCHVTQDPLTCT